MPVTQEEMEKRLSPESLKRAKAYAEEMIAEELMLRELRKELGWTQEQLAEALDIGQESVSRIEKRSDMLLSTLNNYVSAIGGSLEISVNLPDRRIVLSGLNGFLSEKNGKHRRTGKRGMRPRDGVRQQEKIRHPRKRVAV